MAFCPECGSETDGGQRYCIECGASLEAEEPPSESGGSSSPPVQESDDDDDETLFYIGAVLGVVGVIVFPFVFFLVALPEAVYKWRGGSIQNHLPGEASTNSGVRGSMLIMGWFGNFLWLLIALGIVVGLFIAF